MPMAFEDGTTAPEMMLLPYNNDPATGSRIPSMSTGGAAKNAVMKHEVAARRVGNINVPNQPMYRRFSVLVIQFEKRSHVGARSTLLFLSMSTGDKELALSLDVAVLSVEYSDGTKLNEVELELEAEPDRAPALALWFIEATLGTLKASDVEARSATTTDTEIFMIVKLLLLSCDLRS